jgi:hypothetical protein
VPVTFPDGGTDDLGTLPVGGATLTLTLPDDLPVDEFPLVGLEPTDLLGGGHQWWVLTDRADRVVVADLPDGPYQVTVVLPGRPDTLLEVTVDGDTTAAVNLPELATASGVVRDAEDVPVADALVDLTADGDGWTIELLADDDGSWSAEVPVGVYDVRVTDPDGMLLTAERRGFGVPDPAPRLAPTSAPPPAAPSTLAAAVTGLATLRRTALTAAAAADGLTFGCVDDLDARTGYRIRGRITSPLGDGIRPGGTTEVYVREVGRPGTGTPVEVTGSGAFRTPELPSGSYELLVKTADHRPIIHGAFPAPLTTFEEGIAGRLLFCDHVVGELAHGEPQIDPPAPPPTPSKMELFELWWDGGFEDERPELDSMVEMIIRLGPPKDPDEGGGGGGPTGPGQPGGCGGGGSPPPDDPGDDAGPPPTYRTAYLLAQAAKVSHDDWGVQIDQANFAIKMVAVQLSLQGIIVINAALKIFVPVAKAANYAKKGGQWLQKAGKAIERAENFGDGYDWLGDAVDNAREARKALRASMELAKVVADQAKIFVDAASTAVGPNGDAAVAQFELDQLKFALDQFRQGLGQMVKDLGAVATKGQKNLALLSDIVNDVIGIYNDIQEIITTVTSAFQTIDSLAAELESLRKNIESSATNYEIRVRRTHDAWRDYKAALERWNEAKRAAAEGKDPGAGPGDGAGDGGGGGGGGSCPPPGPGPRGPHGPGSGSTATSFDPNEIVGPTGAGEERWIQSDSGLPYYVAFENLGPGSEVIPDGQSPADAPAAKVDVRLPLDEDIDLASVEVGSFGFGDLVYDVPPGRSTFSDERPFEVEVPAFDGEGTETIELLLRADVWVDAVDREVVWVIEALDPETGAWHPDPLAGFLPPEPEDDEGAGQGFGTVFARSVAGSPDGTEVAAQATIVFDTNEPIVTNTWSNRLDRTPPTATVAPLGATTPTDGTVTWSGADAHSGVAHYDVYRSVDGGPLRLWLQDTPETSAPLDGEVGRTYGFAVLAADRAGNVEVTIPAAQATTTAVAPGDDGTDDGSDDGADDGSDDGSDDGTDDGSDDGTDDGSDDGTDDGTDDGSDDGDPDEPGVSPPSCDGVRPVRFPDVATSGVHADAIGCAARLGLVQGREDGRFAPMASLTRGQLASVVDRSLRASGVELPDTASPFVDTRGSVHADAIGRLAAAGIVRGVDGRRFEPQGPVSRAQVATMLDRASTRYLEPYPQVAGPRFPDTVGGPHQAAVDRLGAADVIRGLAPDGSRFGPTRAIRRDQAAALVTRWLTDQAGRVG